MLKPVVYRWHGRYEGYGLKLWPRDIDVAVLKEERFGWLNCYR